ncbi:MAG: MoxR family ATPase [Candidatus Sericytochromatia bacterium]|nr:MoxR family ATPase [Candidatus Sericytochromatia bacterium]
MQSKAADASPSTSPRRILDALRPAVVGHDAALSHVVAALLAGGHILLEDVPGVGKTLIARTLAQVVGGEFKRVQSSPDLMPSDITGTHVFQQGEGSFRFVPGPVFANILLADEINRASPRTQAALLEAMEEGAVTVDGVRHPLPRPFLVVATQNPVEFQGTFPLPEAQLDRFALSLTLGYPEPADEVRLLSGHWARQEELPAAEVVGLETLMAWQEQARSRHVDPTLQEYVVQVLGATRQHPRVLLGVSPRGGLVWQRLAQARAFLEGRDHVVPGDLLATAPLCLNHRLVLAGRSGRAVRQEVLDDILTSVAVPV